MFDRIVKRNYPISVYDGFREVSREHQGRAHAAMPRHKQDRSSLFLGKREDLRGMLPQYIAVERYAPC
jgi:hypothetical protein